MSSTAEHSTATEPNARQASAEVHSAARSRPLYPQLKARPNNSREAVAAHQRKRLHAAMIEAVAESGYGGVRMRQLGALAGVSLRTIYEHFPDKEAYFLSTYDLVVREAMERITVAYRNGETPECEWSAGLCRAFDAYVAELVERPKTSRLAMVEVLAAGPAAESRITRSEAVFTQMIAQSLAQAPDEVALPQLLVRSLVGGIWLVSRTRLLEGRPETIRPCGRELLDLILACRSPAAERLRPIAERTVTPHSGEARPSVDGDRRTRMLRAASRIIAQKGYGALSPAPIVKLAEASAGDFEEEFGGEINECFLASLELLSVEALARAMRESEAAPDWPAAVCRAIRALLCQVAEEPAFARAAFVEVFALGPAGSERRAGLMRSFAAILTRHAPPGRQPSKLIAEAIIGAVWSLVHDRVASDRAAELPLLWSYAAYLALAPIVGAERALEAIDAELPGPKKGTRTSSLSVTTSAVAVAVS
jgi:AcrR family transcriptional regulator